MTATRHSRLRPRRPEDSFIFLLCQPAHHTLDDGSKRRRQRHLDQRESDLVGDGHQIGRDLGVREPGSESHRRHTCRVEHSEIAAALLLSGRQSDAGGEDEFAAGQPPERVEQLRGVRKCDFATDALGAAFEFQREVRLRQHPPHSDRHGLDCTTRRVGDQRFHLFGSCLYL